MNFVKKIRYNSLITQLLCIKTMKLFRIILIVAILALSAFQAQGALTGDSTSGRKQKDTLLSSSFHKYFRFKGTFKISDYFGSDVFTNYWVKISENSEFVFLKSYFTKEFFIYNKTSNEVQLVDTILAPLSSDIYSTIYPDTALARTFLSHRNKYIKDGMYQVGMTHEFDVIDIMTRDGKFYVTGSFNYLDSMPNSKLLDLKFGTFMVSLNSNYKPEQWIFQKFDSVALYEGKDTYRMSGPFVPMDAMITFSKDADEAFWYCHHQSEFSLTDSKLIPNKWLYARIKLDWSAHKLVFLNFINVGIAGEMASRITERISYIFPRLIKSRNRFIFSNARDPYFYIYKKNGTYKMVNLPFLSLNIDSIYNFDYGLKSGLNLDEDLYFALFDMRKMGNKILLDVLEGRNRILAVYDIKKSKYVDKYVSSTQEINLLNLTDNELFISRKSTDNKNRKVPEIMEFQCLKE